MTRDRQIPEMLGKLPSSAVTKHLGRGVQSGVESPPFATLTKSSELMDDSEPRWRAQPVRELLDEAMRQFNGNRVAVDAWLAPRLHATLRLTRSEAANADLWNYIAMVVAPDYVVWRHKTKSKDSELAQPARFSGIHYTQAFSRLWWAAELFRDGNDYGPVETACQVQDVLNTTMRLDVIDHRPTAMAILRIVQRLLTANTTHIGDYVNALSSAVNAAGSTLVYDVLAPDSPVDDEALHAWIAEAANMPPVLWGILPDGPDDGSVDPRSIDAMVEFFEELLAEAPRRNRSRHSAVDSGDENNVD